MIPSQGELVQLLRPLTDASHFSRHTPEWLAYWEQRVDRILMDEDRDRIPLKVVDAIVAAGADTEPPESVLPTTTVKVRTAI